MVWRVGTYMTTPVHKATEKSVRKSRKNDEQDAAAGLSREQAMESPSIALSWRRCKERGQPRDLKQPQEEQARDSRSSETGPEMPNRLAALRPAMEDVYQFVEGSPCVIGFCDANARLLDLIGDSQLLEEMSEIGLVTGSCWSEECAGTNGVALALLESFPTQVNGDLHYCTFFAPYCTSAAPVFDSLGGLVGVLVAVTRRTDSHAHTLGMVSAAASTLTTELRMNLWFASANELLSEMNAILHTLSEGILLLQADGTISQMNARAGHLLGLAPGRVSGRRLADVIDMPAALTEALQLGRELHDEEITFHGRGERIACICTLRAIVPLASLSPVPSAGVGTDGPESWRSLGQSGASLSVTPRSTANGFVLTLRSIERVQRLVHRMSGAHALMRFENIVGQSPELLEAVRLARIAAESHSTVLLHGETGTGKEVFAQSIHNGSARGSGPFVAINCAAIPRELISSELFGYEGGAFTGADRHGRPGKFELANGGTLFLDEIGDMPRDLQTSLLRAIETRSVVRIGGQQVTSVDVRIIAATHKDLAEEVQLGTFRSDLFFRLNVFPIEVPALRDRSGDLALLLRYVLQRLSTRLNQTLVIEARALAALEAYSWPGNVRELENVVERAVYVCERGVIAYTDLPAKIQSASIQQLSRLEGAAAGAVQVDRAASTVAISLLEEGLKRNLRYESETAEANHILRVLRTYQGSVTESAAALGISRTTLWRKKRRYHL
jgi:sigma-54 dependent transcriptional regulator, acetoin dehydrogenase operon transcriptional activator AcoR